MGSIWVLDGAHIRNLYVFYMRAIYDFYEGSVIGLNIIGSQ